MRSLHTISSTYPENSGDILTGSPWSVLTQLCSSSSNGISSAVCRNRRGRWTAIWRGTGATPRLLLFLFVTFTNTKYIWDHIRAKRTQDSQNLFTSLVIKCFRTYGKFPASMTGHMPSNSKWNKSYHFPALATSKSLLCILIGSFN